MRETTIAGPVGALAVADFGGDGPDLLLVHGASRTLLDWRRPNPGCRAIVDIDGFGGSHPRQYPDFDPDEVKRRRRVQTEAVITMMGDERVDAERAQTIIVQARAGAPRIGVTADFEERAARRSLVPDGEGGFLRRPVPAPQRAIAGALEDWDVFAVLTTLTVPALSIHGTRRPAELQAMPDDVRAFLVTVMDSIDADLAALPQRNPLARVALVPEAGHMVHLEATEAVAGHVTAFVAEL